ncbi:MAG: efflux RND transporter periplasmic adaptor subunit [Bacillota bacterium]
MSSTYGPFAQKNSVRPALPAACSLLICLSLFAVGCRSGDPAGPGEEERVYAVTAAEAVLEEVGKQLELTGELAPLRQVVVVPPLPGRVIEIKVAEGDPVFKGQLLIRMDSTQQELQLKQAQIAVEAGRVEIEKLEYLVEQGAVAEQVLRGARAELAQGEAQLDLARYAYDVTFLKSPLAGIVGYIWAKEGELVGNSQVVLVMNLDKVLVQLAVDEAQLVHLAPDMAVQVEVPAIGGIPRGGQVSVIGQVAVPGSRSFPVQIEVENTAGDLKPGMFARVLVQGQSRRAIMVPGSALRESEGRACLFVVSNNRVAERVVETGLRQDGKVEITAGLHQGERYVVRVPAGMADRSAVEISEGE